MENDIAIGLITSNEAAERLGVTVAQVTRLIKAGKLRAKKMADYSNSPWLIDELSVAELVERRNK